METKTLGVIGGVGPLATAYFMELVIEMTQAQRDQQHLPMLIYNLPSIPDRTSYILDHTCENPLPELIRAGQTLVKSGADYMAIPCVTAHYFHEQLAAALSVPLLHLVRETVQHLYDHGVRTAGIMATSGTVSAGLFQRELLQYGMTAVVPDEEHQRDVMTLIYDNVKAGVPVETERFDGVDRALREAGAEAVILGCTELSLIKRDYALGPGFLDAMEVLAQRAVLAGGVTLKPSYRTLITP